MKILTISDNVIASMEYGENLLRNYSEAEAVISCGDMPIPYLDYICSVLNVPMFYVRGNHDTRYDSDHPGGDNLHKRIVRFKGFTFAGLEGCIRYNKDPIQYTDRQMQWMVLELWFKVWFSITRRGKRLDILVTHSPMQGVHDLPDYAHRGFKSLRLAVRLMRPRYMIHGHVDTQDSRRATRTTVYETDVININPVKFMDFENG